MASRRRIDDIETENIQLRQLIDKIRVCTDVELLAIRARLRAGEDAIDVGRSIDTRRQLLPSMKCNPALALSPVLSKSTAAALNSQFTACASPDTSQTLPSNADIIMGQGMAHLR